MTPMTLHKLLTFISKEKDLEKMKSLLIVVAVFFVGCASRTEMPVMDGVLQIDASDVTVTVNDVNVKYDGVVGAYPDEVMLKALFVNEINDSLRMLQEKEPLPLLLGMDKIETNVIYNRNYTLAKGGIGLPGGSYSISALSDGGDVIWENKMDDVVVQGTFFLNILDIYKVPVGQFKQDEEKKYLTIWAQGLADRIYSSQRDKAIEISEGG